MQLNHKVFILGVFGASGAGKNTYVYKFLANVKATCIFIFDDRGQFSAAMDLKPCYTPADIDRAIPTGWVCFSPHKMFPGDLESALDFISNVAYRASEKLHGRKFLVIDELGMYMTGSKVPKPLKTVVQTGRHHGLDSVFIAQQPNELHNTVRAQLTEAVCFQLTDETALKWPKKFGFKEKELLTLPLYHFVCRNKSGLEVRGP